MSAPNTSATSGRRPSTQASRSYFSIFLKVDNGGGLELLVAVILGIVDQASEENVSRKAFRILRITVKEASFGAARCSRAGTILGSLELGDLGVLSLDSACVLKFKMNALLGPGHTLHSLSPVTLLHLPNGPTCMEHGLLGVCTAHELQASREYFRQCRWNEDTQGRNRLSLGLEVNTNPNKCSGFSSLVTFTKLSGRARHDYDEGDVPIGKVYRPANDNNKTEQISFSVVDPVVYLRGFLRIATDRKAGSFLTRSSDVFMMPILNGGHFDLEA
ncbi:hypothetical protein EDC04DRAFT_2607002 [Pisolithus marmoratus]|nr:hypothetical protein EDC04DRAFT_2607002 [Pisolithus marmoratus]